MAGYHNLAGVTAERLTDGWYHTGDLMYRDADGWYFFVGRVDDMFVCGRREHLPRRRRAAAGEASRWSTRRWWCPLPTS